MVVGLVRINTGKKIKGRMDGRKEKNSLTTEQVVKHLKKLDKLMN
jgi:hypothetical protein